MNQLRSRAGLAEYVTYADLKDRYRAFSNRASQTALPKSAYDGVLFHSHHASSFLRGFNDKALRPEA